MIAIGSGETVAGPQNATKSGGGCRGLLAAGLFWGLFGVLLDTIDKVPRRHRPYGLFDPSMTLSVNALSRCLCITLTVWRFHASRVPQE